MDAGLIKTLIWTMSPCLASPLLALRAKVRRALRHQQPPDGRAAGDARLSGPLIDAMAELKKALAALRIDVIGDGRSTGCNGFRQYCADGLVKAAGAIGADTRGQRQRVN